MLYQIPFIGKIKNLADLMILKHSSLVKVQKRLVLNLGSVFV